MRPVDPEAVVRGYARTAMGWPASDPVGDPHAAIRWDAVVDAAIWHRVHPLVYRGVLTAGDIDRVPDPALGRLKQLFVQSLVQHQRRLAELEAALDILNGRDIEVVLLKGAALLGTVYDEGALRPMGDVDLLVRESQVPDADRALRAAGFTSNLAEAEAEKMRREVQHWPSLTRGALTIELHHHLGDGGSVLEFDPSGLFARALPVQWRSAACKTCAPEDLLVHVLLHSLLANLFSATTLSQLVDAAGVVDRLGETIDWERLARESAPAGSGPVLAMMLTATERVLGPAAPNDALRMLAPDGVDPALVDQFLRHRVFRGSAWHRLEEWSHSSHPVRQLLPPRPSARRRGGRERTYVAWARDAGRVARRPRELREALDLYRRVWWFGRAQGQPGTMRERVVRGVWRRPPDQ